MSLSLANVVTCMHVLGQAARGVSEAGFAPL